MTDQPSKVVPVDHPTDAPRTHVPDLEGWAYNQMPKAGWRDLKLFCFDGTDLYQWFGKKGADTTQRDWSVFEDSATEVFLIAAAPQGGGEAAARVQAYLDRRDRARGLDKEDIHGFDVGCPSEAVLTATDLRTVLAALKPQTPDVLGGEGEASRATVMKDDDVWVRAKASDVCTSCVSVFIDTIHKDPVCTYVHWPNVRLAARPSQSDEGEKT